MALAVGWLLLGRGGGVAAKSRAVLLGGWIETPSGWRTHARKGAWVGWEMGGGSDESAAGQQQK